MTEKSSMILRGVMAGTVALGGLSCAEPEPPLTSGVIIDKSHEGPVAWTTTFYMPVAGVHIPIITNHLDGEDWSITVEKCREEDTKCSDQKWFIPESSYNELSVGDVIDLTTIQGASTHDRNNY